MRTLPPQASDIHNTECSRHYHLQPRFRRYRYPHPATRQPCSAELTPLHRHRSRTRILRRQQHDHLPLRRRHITPTQHYAHDTSLRLQRRRPCRQPIRPSPTTQPRVHRHIHRSILLDYGAQPRRSPTHLLRHEATLRKRMEIQPAPTKPLYRQHHRTT